MFPTQRNARYLVLAFLKLYFSVSDRKTPIPTEDCRCRKRIPLAVFGLQNSGGDKLDIKTALRMSNKLMLGMRVEVRSNEDRYDSAWLEGVIMAVYVSPGRGRRYKIRYDPDNCELLTDNGQPLTEEDVSATQVRPIAPSFLEKHSYSVGDVVEVYDNGCWWLGTLIQVLHAGKYFLIHNPHTGLYNKFYPSKLRHAQLWCKGRWSLLSSQQLGDIIYDRNCPMAENSGQTSEASSPGDMKTDVQSQQQPEQEVNKQRRQCGLIGTRVTLKAQGCSNFINARQVIKDLRRSKFSNLESGLKNVEAVSWRNNLHVPHLKGVKRPYVHDDKRDRTFSGIQNGKCNNVKRFKHSDPAEVMEERMKKHEKELQQNIWTCLFAVVMMILSRNYLWLFGLKCELNFDPKNLKQEPTKIWKRNPALVKLESLLLP